MRVLRNQRSEKGKALGLVEGQYDDLMNFERPSAMTTRQKAALAYTEAIAWHLDTDDEFWERMYQHFTEPELVELGCFVGLTLGQQSWLRLLNIDHHEVMPGSEAAMAPGFEDATLWPGASRPRATGPGLRLRRCLRPFGEVSYSPSGTTILRTQVAIEMTMAPRNVAQKNPVE